GDGIGQALRERMLRCRCRLTGAGSASMHPGVKTACFEKTGHILRGNRTISDAACRSLYFYQRLEPKQPARTIAHDANRLAALLGFPENGGGDGIGTHSQSCSVAWHVNGDRSRTHGASSRLASNASKRSQLMRA